MTDTVNELRITYIFQGFIYKALQYPIYKVYQSFFNIQLDIYFISWFQKSIKFLSKKI